MANSIQYTSYYGINNPCVIYSAAVKKNKELRKERKHVLFAQYCFINVCVKKKFHDHKLC